VVKQETDNIWQTIKAYQNCPPHQPLASEIAGWLNRGDAVSAVLLHRNETKIAVAEQNQPLATWGGA